MRPTNRRPRNTKRLPAPCPLHVPPLSRPSATLSPPCGERAGRGVPIWFMAPMRVQILEVPPAHEPPPLPPFGHPLPRGGGEGRGEGAVGRFKGAMHVRSSGSSLLREGRVRARFPPIPFSD